jgi:hypothetical protein
MPFTPSNHLKINTNRETVIKTIANVIAKIEGNETHRHELMRNREHRMICGFDSARGSDAVLLLPAFTVIRASAPKSDHIIPLMQDHIQYHPIGRNASSNPILKYLCSTKAFDMTCYYQSMSPNFMKRIRIPMSLAMIVMHAFAVGHIKAGRKVMMRSLTKKPPPVANAALGQTFLNHNPLSNGWCP